MIIIRDVNAPASFVFTKLIDSSLYDIKKQTNKRLTWKQLKNFEYVKTFSRHQKARITILDVVENEKYSFKTSTTSNEYVTTYTIEPKTDVSCKVTCEETKTSHGFMQKLNDTVVGLILGRSKKKQIKAILDEMGKQYKG
ncbi:MAG: DUF3284 domain-containing protein [Streptococcaceae bacterium]|jgi:hypothetical protein|nr:DUF3284 domain-containing protein [Streptococcaceae bacterium]